MNKYQGLTTDELLNLLPDGLHLTRADTTKAWRSYDDRGLKLWKA